FLNVSITFEASINQPARNRTIAIDSPIPQERPITARVFEQAQINLANQNFFLVMRSLCDYTTEWIRQKRPAPEFQALSCSSFIAAYVALLKPHAIHRGHINRV